MKVSAGLLMYRHQNSTLEVFLAHPGGPFFARKDLGAWSIPKGLCHKSENLLAAAKREFTEETGIKIPENATFVPLGEIKQLNNKIVHTWAFEWKEHSIPKITSNPSKFGWPEIDRAQFFPLDLALQKILPAQKEFLLRLSKLI